MSLDIYPATPEYEFPIYTPDQSTPETCQPGVQIPDDTTILEMLARYRFGRRADNPAVIDIQST